MQSLRSNIRQHISPSTLNFLLIIGVTIGITIVTMSVLYLIYKNYVKNRDRFKSVIDTNRFVYEQKDNITKWIENTEKRIKKNNVKIKAKRYIVIATLSFISAFIFSINVFKNLTASILFSAIFFVIPEYLLSLYEDSIERKIEEQLLNAIKLFTAEFMQRKPLQKIFSVMSTKISDPVGRYFSDAYYEMITGTSVDVVLSRLTSRFNSNYGKLFIQFIKQAQRDGNVVNLLPELMIKIEDHMELTRSNKANIAGDRLQAFLISLLPIPAYFTMARFFPETKIFIQDTYYGRLIITLSFLSIFVFIVLDRFIRRVE